MENIPLHTQTDKKWDIQNPSDADAEVRLGQLMTDSRDGSTSVLKSKGLAESETP